MTTTNMTYDELLAENATLARHLERLESERRHRGEESSVATTLPSWVGGCLGRHSGGLHLKCQLDARHGVAAMGISRRGHP